MLTVNIKCRRHCQRPLSLFCRVLNRPLSAQPPSFPSFQKSGIYSWHRAPVSVIKLHPSFKTCRNVRQFWAWDCQDTNSSVHPPKFSFIFSHLKSENMLLTDIRTALTLKSFSPISSLLKIPHTSRGRHAALLNPSSNHSQICHLSAYIPVGESHINALRNNLSTRLLCCSHHTNGFGKNSAALQLSDENPGDTTTLSVNGAAEQPSLEPWGRAPSSEPYSPTLQTAAAPVWLCRPTAQERATASRGDGVRQEAPSLLTAAAQPPSCPRGQRGSRASPSFGGKRERPRRRRKAHARAAPEGAEVPARVMSDGGRARSAQARALGGGRGACAVTARPVWAPAVFPPTPPCFPLHAALSPEVPREVSREAAGGRRWRCVQLRRVASAARLPAAPGPCRSFAPSPAPSPRPRSRRRHVPLPASP